MVTQFPLEVLEDVIAEAWSSPLSLDERVLFMTTSVLVCKHWMQAFLFVSARDVYIPCPSYGDQFLRLLAMECPVYGRHTASLRAWLCRSITFHVEPTSSPPIFSSSEVHRLASSISSTLYAIETLDYLPNLRHVVAHHVNMPLDDLIDQGRLFSFPKQVTRLDISYSFDKSVPEWLARGIRAGKDCKNCSDWYLPSVRYLSIVGASDAMTAATLYSCPNVDVLVTDSKVCLDVAGPKFRPTAHSHMQSRVAEFVQVVEAGSS